MQKGMLEIKSIIFLAIVALLLTAALFYPYYKPRKTIWCYYKHNVTEMPLPRYECVHMKIMSKDVNKVDVEQFHTFNISDVGCFNSYDKLPSCLGNDFYFAQFDLNEFTPKKTEGDLCVAYYITFYESNDTYADYYNDIFGMQDFKVKAVNEELNEKIINCKVR